MQTSWGFFLCFFNACAVNEYSFGLVSCVCFEILFWTLFIPLDLRNIHNQALYWLVLSVVFSSVSEFVWFFYISGSCLIMLVRFHVQSVQVSSLCCHQRLLWKSVFSLFHYPFCLPSRVTVSGLSMLVCFHCHRKFICLQSCFLCFNMCHHVLLAPVPVFTRLSVGLNVGVLGPV